MRIGALAAVALLVAQPQLRNRLGGWFAGSKTHHIVLLDDSFSMSDRWSDTSAFAQGKRVVERLAARAARQETPQTFTLRTMPARVAAVGDVWSGMRRRGRSLTRPAGRLGRLR